MKLEEISMMGAFTSVAFGMSFMVSGSTPGPGVYEAVVVMGDQVGVFPFSEGFYLVGSHNQLEFMTRIFLTQVGKGIDGVGGGGEFKFDIRYPEPVIILKGKADHLQPVVIA